MEATRAIANRIELIHPIRHGGLGEIYKGIDLAELAVSQES